MKLSGFKKTQLALATALCAMGSAQAGVIDMDNGMQAVWSLNASLSSGWRTKDADPQLIGKGDGGSASSYTATASDKNFGKGEMFSELLRVVGDVDLKSGDNGLFLRAKVWDNQRLSSQSVAFGAPTNKFAPNSKLSDSQFDTNLSKFSGAELLDAYVYTRFDISDDIQAKVKLGNHAVNFGESLFIPGVNQYSVLDVNALRQPGTLIKEAILPVPQLSANVGLPGGVSVEGFYQFQWQRTSLDGCGTYWSAVSALNCTNDTVLIASDAAGSFTSSQYYNGVPALGGANFKFLKAADRTPDNPNQFGLSAKKTVESLDTEFGAYFVNYTTHTPIISVVRAPGTVAGSLYYAGGFQKGAAQWDYTASDIQVTGLSASTVLGGWAVAGELSYTKDFPVQISAADILAGFAGANGAGLGAGKARFGSAAAPLGSGQYVAGYDRKDKAQIQMSTIKTFSNVLGASGASLVGEVAYQHWNGIGDPFSGTRYGRGFEFGAAQHATTAGVCALVNKTNCTQDGYFTSDAWGFRVQAELEYPNVFAGVNLKPRLFYSQDVQGWSADSVFSQGRQAVSLAVRAEYLRKYYMDVSVTMYNPDAHFDSFHDRDNIGLVIGASF